MRCGRCVKPTAWRGVVGGDLLGEGDLVERMGMGVMVRLNCGSLPPRTEVWM